MVLAFLLVTGNAGAETVTLSASSDSLLHSANTTTNYETSTSLDSATGTGDDAWVFKFDLSSIPAGSTIKSAVIRIYESLRGSGGTFIFYRLVRDWTESGVTYNTYDGSNNWGTAGALNSSTDYTATDSVTTGNANGGWVTAVVTNIVSAQFSGNNYGIIMRRTGSNAYDFINSSENASNNPELIVTYTLASYDATFQEGVSSYAGTADSHIIEYATGNNMGGNNEMEAARYVGSSSSDDKAALIKFDVSSIPSTATVDSAYLLLYNTQRRNNSFAKTLSIARLKLDWGEGAQTGIDGASASSGDVTWASAEHTITSWNTAGALGANDKYADEDSKYIIEWLSSGGAWYSFDITDMAQAWVTNSADNFGALIYEASPSTSDGTVVFATSENATTANRPLLVINYTEAASNPISIKVNSNLKNTARFKIQ